MEEQGESIDELCVALARNGPRTHFEYIHFYIDHANDNDNTKMIIGEAHMFINSWHWIHSSSVDYLL